MENLEGQLNKEQLEAVLQVDGPLLVLSGAGSGKTRVLTYRVAHLVEDCHVNPFHILAITFTNKAAGEMKERIEALLSPIGGGYSPSQDIWVSTFHSMCVRILRRNIQSLGYQRDFSIYDTDDQRSLMRLILKDLRIDAKILKERAVLSEISKQKNQGIRAEEYQKTVGDNLVEKRIAECYIEYEKRLKKNNALDFDDLLLVTLDLFRAFPEVLAYYQEKFHYILVDEYQDTNDIQFELVKLLAEKYRNICVVGDDDQSIYSFRGANIQNILSFESVYPDAKVVKLEENYRSSKRILDIANVVISHNKKRKEKKLWTEKKEGSPVCFREFMSDKEEAIGVIREVRESKKSLKEQVILYRTNAQSRLFEEQCIQHNIPYRIIGGVNFYQRREIKDILAYMKILVNEQDDIAFQRIINLPKRGIGPGSIQKLQEKAALYPTPLSLLESARLFHQEIRGKAGKSLLEFLNMLDAYREKLAISGLLEEEKKGEEAYSLKSLIESLRDDTGYAMELLAEGEVESKSRLENIEELINKAATYEEENEFPTLSGFLAEVSLLSDLDTVEQTEESLTMMTLHGAKGLEFPKVYLVGLNDGIFPSFFSLREEEDMEEERRLCYVGLTRAEEELFLSCARSRMLHGETQQFLPSRFVKEMPDDLVEKSLLYKEKKNFEEISIKDTPFSHHVPTKYASFSSRESIQKSKVFSHEIANLMKKGMDIQKADRLDYQEGDRVKHIKFGEGEVLSIKEEKRDFLVTVQFDGIGPKKMFASFAKLKKI